VLLGSGGNHLAKLVHDQRARAASANVYAKKVHISRELISPPTKQVQSNREKAASEGPRC
jgi:hypothetical protein